jgi:hypothetical protein
MGPALIDQYLFQQHRIARDLQDAINEVSTLLANWQR